MFSPQTSTSFPTSIGSGFQFNQSQPTGTSFNFGVTGGTPSFTTPILNFPPSSNNSTTLPILGQQSQSTPFTFGTNSNLNNNGITNNSVPSFSFSPPTNNNSTGSVGNPGQMFQLLGGGSDISSVFSFGTFPTPFNSPELTTTFPIDIKDKEGENEVLANQRKIVHGIYSNDILIGFTIIRSKIDQFWNHIVNFNDDSFSKRKESKCDKEMLEIASFISQYCLENDKSLTPTSQCGLFLFENTPEQKNSLVSFKYRRTNKLFTKKSSCNYTPSGENWSSKRRKSSNDNSQFIFKPKILTFLNSCDSLCRHSVPQFLSKHPSLNVKNCTDRLDNDTKISSNLLKRTFPPKQDFLKLTTTCCCPTGNLPFRLDGLLTPRPPSKKQLPPLNYDDYLQKYSDEQNKIFSNSLYWGENGGGSEQKSVDILMGPKTSKFSKSKMDWNEIKNELVKESLSRFEDKSKEEEVDHNDPESSSSDLESVESTMILKSSINNTDNFDPKDDDLRVMEDEGQKSCTLSESTLNDLTKCCQNSLDDDDDFSVRARSKFLSSRTCRVNLTRKFYYCQPTLGILDSLVDSSGHCWVKEFLVGHENFGKISFHGLVDVMGLNLDEIIDFKLKEFTLYPDEDEDRRVRPGQGLKVPATITLFNVWLMDKERTHFMTDLNYIQSVNYEGTLKRSCQRMGAQFVSYKPDLGRWTFRIHGDVPQIEGKESLR